MTNQNGESKASAHMATELLKLLLYKGTVIKELYPSDWEARNWYWRWVQKSVVCGFHNPMFVFFLDEASPICSGNINNMYQHSKNQHAVHEGPICDLQAKVRCTAITCKIIGYVFQ